MKMFKHLVLLTLCFFWFPQVNAQTTDNKGNIVKVNLAGIPLNNYGVQYERVLTKRVSIAFNGRYMPKSHLPFKKHLMNAVEDDNQDAIDMIDNIRLSNYALTPEVKFYLGKGYGEGFYVSLFYRYAHFEISEVPITYTTDFSIEETFNMKGSLGGHSGGFLLGWQKSFKDILVLDLWFLGPHIGISNSSLTGTSSHVLSENEQQAIRDLIDEVDIPLFNVKTEFEGNAVKTKVDGIWAGIRLGISLGIRF